MVADLGAALRGDARGSAAAGEDNAASEDLGTAVLPFAGVDAAAAASAAAGPACSLALLRLADTLTHLGLAHSSVPSGAVCAT